MGQCASVSVLLRLSMIVTAPSQRRFADAWLLRRFSHLSYQWYNLGAPPPGLSWLINPRDCTGVGTIYINGQTEGAFDEKSEIVIVQTSVPDNQRAPVVRNRTRMEL